MFTKPTSKPSWTNNNPSFPTVTVEPTAAKKQAGWAPDERPPAEFLNWLFYNVGEWISYFETITDNLVTRIGQYDAIIGFGGTHATINDVMNDANINNIKRVLVTQSIVIDEVQLIDKNDMTLMFKPQAVVVMGESANGLKIDAERVKVIGARFKNFTGKALELSEGSRNCLVAECSFLDNGVMIENLGTGNVLSNNIEEV